MRSSDEIKKGLECCATHDCKGCGYNCGASTCIDSLLKDISSLIQQLETDKQQLEGMLTHMNQLRDAAAGRALKMEERVHQLETERDALMTFMQKECYYCKHNFSVHPDCPCVDCDGESHFEWSGAQREE